MSFRYSNSVWTIIVIIGWVCCVTNVSCFMIQERSVVVVSQSDSVRSHGKSRLFARQGGILETHGDGDIFQLQRFSGKIEFGTAGSATIRLMNNDDDVEKEALKEWLQDSRQVARSIWKDDMIQELGENVFRLELMSLQLVTIQLKPTVDIKMWTDDGVFHLKSVGFDPNIQTFVGISPDSLLLQVEVEGVLSPTKDGRGLTGRIGFLSTGVLPPPMRMIPEPILQTAITTINRTVSAFAMWNFQQGVKTNFRQFLRTYHKVNVEQL